MLGKKLLGSMGLVALSLIITPIPSMACGKVVHSEPNVKIEKISMEDLKKAIADKKATIIDCNSSESYAEGHISGALSNKADDVVSKLPADKSAMVVCYCEDDKSASWKSGTIRLTKLGYTNVKLYSGGLKEWKDAGGELVK